MQIIAYVYKCQSWSLYYPIIYIICITKIIYNYNNSWNFFQNSKMIDLSDLFFLWYRKNNIFYYKI